MEYATTGASTSSSASSDVLLRQGARIVGSTARAAARRRAAVQRVGPHRRERVCRRRDDDACRPFSQDPPLFLARTPHGYFDREAIAADLARARFGATPRIETEAARSRAASPSGPAIGCCQGTPLRNEIEARSPAGLAAAKAACTAAVAERFGHVAVDAKIQAHIVTVQN
jgi:hypothetical protein